MSVLTFIEKKNSIYNNGKAITTIIEEVNKDNDVTIEEIIGGSPKLQGAG